MSAIFSLLAVYNFICRSRMFVSVMIFGISCKDFLTIRSVSVFFAGIDMPYPNTLRAVSEVVCSRLVLPIFSGDLGLDSSKT